jgi:putative flippase GtrA
MFKNPNIRYLWGKIGKYFSVGILGLIIDNGVLLLLINIFNVSPQVSTLIAAECGNLNNFFINDKWTFRDSKDSSSFWSRILKYHAAIIVGYVISRILVFPIVYSFVSPHFGHNISALISNNLSIATSFIFNFLINSLWTWRKSKRGVVEEVEGVIEDTEFR